MPRKSRLLPLRRARSVILRRGSRLAPEAETLTQFREVELPLDNTVPI